MDSQEKKHFKFPKEMIENQDTMEVAKKMILTCTSPLKAGLPNPLSHVIQ